MPQGHRGKTLDSAAPLVEPPILCCRAWGFHTDWPMKLRLAGLRGTVPVNPTRYLSRA
jgi:hypothetical protein